MELVNVRFGEAWEENGKPIAWAYFVCVRYVGVGLFCPMKFAEGDEERDLEQQAFIPDKRILCSLLKCCSKCQPSGDFRIRQVAGH